jgi:phenylalanyl-tRNA synthetase alpha chain
MSIDASALHPIEKSILKALANNEHIWADLLTIGTGLSIDQVRRGIEWLKFKNLISMTEKSEPEIVLLANGQKAKDKRLPERRLAAAVEQNSKTINDILASGELDKDEINAAIKAAKDNNWITIEGGKVKRIAEIHELVRNSHEERFINKFKISGKNSMPESEFDEEERKGFELLSKRPNYVEKRENKRLRVELTDAGRLLLTELKKEIQTERRMTPQLITSGKWKEVSFSALDVQAPAPAVFPGRRHPLVDIIEEVKEIFVGLGFSEIDGPMVQLGFWNFDALFTPQDHPAREMQDTFYISGQRQRIPATDDQIKKVSQVHRRGWGGWESAEAERIVLRTHTTPVTLQHLARLKPEAARFFSVGRVFRNEKVSYKHLVEFHQVEGVATAPRASLRDLMGLQKEFYARMGIKKVKFWPTFFPYTEPSLQSMVYNEKLEKWVELFGMGIFRPEVTEPLGIKNPVLAWGGGLERIAMLRFGLDDVRELYGNRLSWLRSVPRCQL